MRELAEVVGGRVVGDPERTVAGVRSLDCATESDLSWLTGAGYRKAAAESRAGALLTSPSLASGLDVDLVLCDQPELGLARVLAALHPPKVAAPGVHPTAVIARDATLGAGVHVGPHVVIGAAASVGRGATLRTGVVIGDGCVVGERAELHPYVVVYDRCEIGDDVVIHAGTVIGAAGFGYVVDEGALRAVPQVGRVVLEPAVEVGANSAIDRATVEETRIGSGTKIDNLVQIGHNVSVGRGCILCGQVGVAGSTKLGNGVVLAGRAGVGGHLELGDGVQVAAAGVVLRSAAPGEKLGGIPAIPLRSWQRQQILVGRLAELQRRIDRLEAAVEEEAESER